MLMVHKEKCFITLQLLSKRYDNEFNDYLEYLIDTMDTITAEPAANCDTRRAILSQSVVVNWS